MKSKKKRAKQPPFFLQANKPTSELKKEAHGYFIGKTEKTAQRG